MDLKQHEKFMKRCIELAQEALNNGDNPFGSIVVKDGKIISEARNNALHDDMTDHAEVMAMRRAREALGTPDLSGCTLYTNCEPCPMCSFMIREQKITSAMATSLANDSNDVALICQKLITAAELIYAHSDTLVELMEEKKEKKEKKKKKK